MPGLGVVASSPRTLWYFFFFLPRSSVPILGSIPCFKKKLFAKCPRTTKNLSCHKNNPNRNREEEVANLPVTSSEDCGIQSFSVPAPPSVADSSTPCAPRHCLLLCDGVDLFQFFRPVLHTCPLLSTAFITILNI